jgi:hypothetical protein
MLSCLILGFLVATPNFYYPLSIFAKQDLFFYFF